MTIPRHSVPISSPFVDQMEKPIQTLQCLKRGVATVKQKSPKLLMDPAVR